MAQRSLTLQADVLILGAGVCGAGAALRLAGAGLRVRWLDALPPAVHGAMVANEVLDVVPVHLVHWTADGPMERCVALAGAGIGGQGIAGAGPSFAWVDRPITERGLSAAIERLPIPATADGYLSEVAPAAAAASPPAPRAAAAPTTSSSCRRAWRATRAGSWACWRPSAQSARAATGGGASADMP
jgi:hypothetical protein